MSIPALSGLPSEPVHSGISNMTGVLPGNDHAVSSDPARCIFW